MTVLCVPEHTDITIADRFSANPIQPSIGRRHAILVDRLNRKLKADGRVAPFELGYRSVRTRQYCGVLTIGHEAIEVLPKIDRLAGEETDTEARIRLLDMLAVTRRLPIHPVEASKIARCGEHLLEIFISLFASQSLALIRNGLVHRYESQHDELGVVRGKILHSRQLISNLAYPHRIWCAFDEFTPDNALNRVIKAAARRCLATTTVSSSQSTLREVLYSLDDVRNTFPQAIEFKSLPRERLSKPYREVLDFAGTILFGPMQDVVSGRDTHMALLFDMNLLYEQYIGCHLRKLASDSGIEVSLQGPRLWLGKEAGVVEGDRFQLRPDAVLSVNGQVMAVLDTKWKVLEGQDPVGAVSEGDAYQMLAYMTRYNVDTAVLLYPWRLAARTGPVLSEIGICSKRLLIAGVNLHDLKAVPDQLRFIVQKWLLVGGASSVH